MTASELAELDELNLIAKLKAKKPAVNDYDRIIYGMKYKTWIKERQEKRNATIARRKPIYDKILKQQKQWDHDQSKRWRRYWRDQIPEERLYEVFFRRLYLDDWSE